MHDQAAALAQLTTQLANLREVAAQTREVVQQAEEQFGHEVFSSNEDVLDARIRLACMNATLELIEARITAHETVQAAETKIGTTLHAAYREIYGRDPPDEYVFPMPIAY